MKSLETVLKSYVFVLAGGMLLLVGCSMTDSSASSDLEIHLSDYTLSQSETVDYTITNKHGNKVYIFINGSVSNIEKQTTEGWIRLINTVPHHPVVLRLELKPNETLERTITYDLIEALVDSVPGTYRIYHDYGETRSDMPEHTIHSRVFVIE